MTSAFVEYRPKSSDQTHGVTHHVLEVDGKEVAQFTKQIDAEKWACKQGSRMHVARERHRQDKPNPARWRVSDCKA